MEQFKVVKEIGRGGYGRALLAKSIQNSELRVIKEMNLSKVPAAERDNAMHEADILSTLKHTNIIRYRGCTKHKKFLYILMDYADGGDLSQAIANQKGTQFSEDTIMDWFVQLCLAIKYIHDRKILHRDLKPQNVFLSHGNIIKLGDFGISTTLDNTDDMAATAIGTPLYCSPEICMGNKYNAKSDIWSLGCILYELITLRRPFSGINVSDIMRRIISRPHKPIPQTYSDDIKILVDSLLDKNPDQRPTINEILGSPLLRSKAIALLGVTQARAELNHGIFHGIKPGLTPEGACDDIELVIPNQGGKDTPKCKEAGIFKEMKKMAANLKDVIDSKNLIDVPEEVASLGEGEFYFMGRKLIMKGVKDSDPLMVKIESVRIFLEEVLGVDKLKEIYQAVQQNDTPSKLLMMTKSDMYMFQLVLQLVAYEKQL